MMEFEGNTIRKVQLKLQYYYSERSGKALWAESTNHWLVSLCLPNGVYVERAIDCPYNTVIVNVILLLRIKVIIELI
jgi:hypothetical protein